MPHTIWAVASGACPRRSCRTPAAVRNPSLPRLVFGCTASQLGGLFYNESGGVKGSTIELTPNADYYLFNNFQPYLYWSSTAWARVPNSAFSFSFGNGFQGTNVYVNVMYAIAVAPGKVGFRASHGPSSLRPSPR